MRNEDTEEVSQAEKMLELPLVWNKVQDLIMDVSEVPPVKHQGVDVSYSTDMDMCVTP